MNELMMKLFVEQPPLHRVRKKTHPSEFNLLTSNILEFYSVEQDGMVLELTGMKDFNRIVLYSNFP